MTVLGKWRDDVMRFRTARKHARSLGLLCGLGTLFHAGACDLGTITTTSTQTLDGSVVIVDLVRSIIITPLDEYVTEVVSDAFDSDDD